MNCTRVALTGRTSEVQEPLHRGVGSMEVEGAMSIEVNLLDL